MSYHAVPKDVLYCAGFWTEVRRIAKGEERLPWQTVGAFIQARGLAKEVCHKFGNVKVTNDIPLSLLSRLDEQESEIRILRSDKEMLQTDIKRKQETIDQTMIAMNILEEENTKLLKVSESGTLQHLLQSSRVLWFCPSYFINLKQDSIFYSHFKEVGSAHKVYTTVTCMGYMSVLKDWMILNPILEIVARFYVGWKWC